MMIRLKDLNQNDLLHSTDSYNYSVMHYLLKQYWNSNINASKTIKWRFMLLTHTNTCGQIFCSALRINLEGSPPSREESPHTLLEGVYSMCLH